MRTDTSASDTVHWRTDTSGYDTVHLRTDTSGSDTVHWRTDTSGSDTVHWRTDTSGSDNVHFQTDTDECGTDIFHPLIQIEEVVETSNFEQDHEVYCNRSILNKCNTKFSILCNECNMKLSSKRALRRHIKNQHVHKTTRSMSHIVCNDPSCSEKFMNVKELCKHLSVKHEIYIEEKTETFDSEEEFLSWKIKEESNNNVQFACQYTKQKKDRTVKLFKCNRSGKSKVNKLKGSSKRSKNKKGSCKIGHVCPARMIVCLRDNMVTVKYTNVHFHPTGLDQTKYLRIAAPDRKEISTKLRIGVPPLKILSSLRSEVCDIDNRQGSNLKQRHFITMKDIHNIKSRQIQISTDRHTDDATSVHLRVIDLQKSPSNPVLLYKQQQVVNEDINLNKDDFMLVLMTNEQSENYEKFAPYVLCIDSTHGTNQYQFYLITILVVNDEKKGIPVAFCISNKEDERALKIFFQSVKDRCPNTVIDSIMTDDAHASCNAAKAVFGHSVAHYLCIYHVRSNWNKKLRGNPEELAALQKALTELVHADTKEQFMHRLTQLRYSYGESHATFFKYFDQHYLHRPHKWALYARKEGLRKRTVTNNHIERFHRTLKYTYLNQKYNRRIDRLVDVLLEFEKHRYMDLIRDSFYENQEFDKSGRHDASCGIPDTDVQMVNEITYSVLSSDGLKVYYVQVLKSECDIKPCFLTCCTDPCFKLCIHLYKCSCLDKSACCKHVHKVHSMRSLIFKPMEECDQPAVVNTNEPDTNDDNDDDDDVGNLRQFYHHLHQLESVIATGVCKDRLSLVNKALGSLRSDIDAYLTIESKIAEMSPKENIHPNKKIDKQPTFKKLKRKKAPKRSQVITIIT